jgi:nucleoid DNA-binding protein
MERIENRVNKEKIISDIARRSGLTERQVNDIVNSEWKFLANTIEAGEFDAVQVPRLGRWWVKLKRLQLLNIRK